MLLFFILLLTEKQWHAISARCLSFPFLTFHILSDNDYYFKVVGRMQIILNFVFHVSLSSLTML